MVPWDSAVFGFPVAQVEGIELTEYDQALVAYAKFRIWLESKRAQIVTCRLKEHELFESMFLEEQGFRFVEMVLHPIMASLSKLVLPADDLLIEAAVAMDIPLIQAIAERSFHYERYHVDPRLDHHLGDLRYGRWVRTCTDNPAQQLLKILDGTRLVGFFLVEIKQGDQAYWHLTAIAPEYQGQGYGKRVWQAMLRYHQQQGLVAVSTTISARNMPVLNLYSRLGFRFLPSEMTFHWVRT